MHLLPHFTINLRNAWIKAFVLKEDISSRWTAQEKRTVQKFSSDLVIKGSDKSTPDTSSTIDNLVQTSGKDGNGTLRILFSVLYKSFIGAYRSFNDGA